MKIDLFKFSNYKQYLSEKIEYEAKQQKGYRIQLCEHIGIQASYLSQVLNGRPDLTLEQGHKLNSFFSHTKEETKLFMLLLEKSRAGTRDLEKYFKEQIEELQQVRFDLKKRLKETQEISDQDHNKYYSSWFYSAIYVLLSIPEYQEMRAISERLNLPIELVKEVVFFLENCGLIENIKGKYILTKRSIHLNRESIFIQRHHINWRSQSLQSVEKNLPEDLHYSSVIAISKNDFYKIKEVFVDAIEAARQVIKPSKEEEIYSITLDVFKL
ncbi:MAG: TIGR02147 family protein [Bacteriovoracaceae bacterium]